VPTVDHYATLGMPPTATAAELRAAYRNLARRVHPDGFSDPAERRRAEGRMAAVNEAWRVLGDPGRRSGYDRTRAVATPATRPVDEPAHRTDAFVDVRVSPAVGCMLQFLPVVFGLLVLALLLVVTALAGSGGGGRPVGLVPGRCVEIDDGLRAVPCTVDAPVIVARGVAGTSCPVGSVAVVLPYRTEQVCVAPPGMPGG